MMFLQILAGHKDNAEFALAMCPTEPFVLSGGWDYFLLAFSSISTLFFCSIDDESLDTFGLSDDSCGRIELFASFVYKTDYPVIAEGKVVLCCSCKRIR